MSAARLRPTVAPVDGMRWLRRMNPLLVDALLGVGIGVLEVLSLRGAHPPALAFVLAGGGPLLLTLRRRWPSAVLTAVLAVEAAYAALGYPYPGAGPALLLAAYSVGAHRPRSASMPALAASWTVLAALTALTGWAPIDLGTAVVVTGAAWLLGDSHRARRETIAVLEERTAELERLQGRLAAQAAAAERTRIARELHDVVAHAMSVIAIQSGVGERLVDARPDQARRALATIRDVSRDGLDELRRMLGVLRAEEPDTLRPAPRLADLPGLITQAEQAGLRVHVTLEGGVHELPEALELAAYRIVQEALTNVAKHAGPTDVHVGLRCSEREIGIDVHNAATGRAPGGSDVGVGLIGMQERVRMFGGQLEYGRHDGGFRVTARLPLPQARR